MSGLCRFGLARAELKGPGNGPKNQITRVSAGIIRKAALWKLCRTRHNFQGCLLAGSHRRRRPERRAAKATQIWHDHPDSRRSRAAYVPCHKTLDRMAIDATEGQDVQFLDLSAQTRLATRL